MKILITGTVASGKTTLAKRLSEEFAIPWHELDEIVRPLCRDRRKRTREEQLEVISRIDRDESWIFEGTNRASYRYLFDMADMVIYINPPLVVRSLRILTRFIKQKFGLETSLYRPNLYMLGMMFKWTFDFEKNRRSFNSFLEQFNHKLIEVKSMAKIDWSQRLELSSSPA